MRNNKIETKYEWFMYSKKFVNHEFRVRYKLQRNLAKGILIAAKKLVNLSKMHEVDFNKTGYSKSILLTWSTKPTRKELARHNKWIESQKTERQLARDAAKKRKLKLARKEAIQIAKAYNLI